MKKMYLAQIRGIPEKGGCLKNYVRFLSNGNPEPMLYSTTILNVVEIKMEEPNQLFIVETRNTIYIAQLV